MKAPWASLHSTGLSDSEHRHCQVIRLWTLALPLQLESMG